MIASAQVGVRRFSQLISKHQPLKVGLYTGDILVSK